MTSVSFFVFHNASFTENNEDDNGNNLISHVLYQYKNILSDDDLNNLLNSIVSLYTFTTISIGDKEVQFLSFDSFNIAIHTSILNDKSTIFFILRLSNYFSDKIVCNALNRITKGIIFTLGNTFNDDIQILKDYLNKEGDRIIDFTLNPLNLEYFDYNIIFPSLHKFNSDNCAIMVTTLMSSIQKLNHKIWGASCFINHKLLISQIPLSLCSLFEYIPANQSNFHVFLTKSQREKLIKVPNLNIEIPDLEIIPSLLLIFADSLKKITFYILADPSFLKDDLTINKIKEMFDVSFPFIYENWEDSLSDEIVANTIGYNSELLDFKCGKMASAFEENILIGRNEFIHNDRLTEIIMKNPDDFTICYKIISFEYYSFIEDNGKYGFIEMYQKCINLNPSLKKYIDLFRPNESS